MESEADMEVESFRLRFGDGRSNCPAVPSTVSAMRSSAISAFAVGKMYELEDVVRTRTVSHR
jgi:hypothetical protein